MKLPKKIFLIKVFLALGFNTIFAPYGFTQASQTFIGTNGYLCAPKNPGGEETRLFFRQQDGYAINLSSSATFPVVCPVLSTYSSTEIQEHGVAIRLGNKSNVGQNFACALEEYDSTFTQVRSIGKALFLEPFQAGSLQYTGIFLLATQNTLSLRCIIPPRGVIGKLGSY